MELLAKLDEKSKVLVEEQLRMIILSVIDETAHEYLNTRRYLKKCEASEYAHVSIVTFNKWIAEGLPNHPMRGSGVTLFDRLEIDQWIGNNGYMTDVDVRKEENQKHEKLHRNGYLLERQFIPFQADNSSP